MSYGSITQKVLEVRICNTRDTERAIQLYQCHRYEHYKCVSVTTPLDLEQQWGCWRNFILVSSHAKIACNNNNFTVIILNSNNSTTKIFCLQWHEHSRMRSMVIWNIFPE